MLNHRMISCVSFSTLISFFIFSPNVIAQSKVNNVIVNNKQKPLTTSKIKSTSIPKKQVTGTLELSRKVSMLNKELSKTKSALSLEKKTRASRDKQITKLTNDLKSIKSQVSKKDKELSKTKSALSLEKKTRASRDEQITKLTADMETITSQISQKEAELIKLKDAYEEAKTLNLLYDEIKFLEALLTEKDTELISLKDKYKKSNAIVLSNVIDCYKEAFDVWNKMHRIREDMDKEESQQGLLIISTELRKAINSCPPI